MRQDISLGTVLAGLVNRNFFRDITLETAYEVTGVLAIFEYFLVGYQVNLHEKGFSSNPKGHFISV